MRTQIFKQYSGPWASLPFPGGGTNVKGAGCGLCSVTHILIEDDRYKNYTPTDVRPYMVKWAVRNQGLIHDGIPDTLRHYGMENVKEFGRNATMNDIFTELNKGSRKGVILFYKPGGSAKGPDGTVWTGGGHFVAFLDYKIQNGKHLFYVKDSGSRNHDGWYSYESSMRGCVWKVWTCTVPNSATAKKTETKTTSKETKVIDVSYIQSSINWDKVKAAGVDGVMIRCGYRGYGSGKLQEDSCFSKHVKGAVKAGLKVGVYFFTEAINAKEGKEEADFAINLVKREGLKLSYPIAVDTESISASGVRANNLSVSVRTAAIQAFCEEVKAKGYEPMIYASTSWLVNKLNMKVLPYKVWVAQYNTKVTYSGSYVMWQYTSTGVVDGISGVVDMNHCYISGTTSAQTKTTDAKATLNTLKVDGVVGTETVKAAQVIFGTPTDGVISGQAKSDMAKCPAISKTCLKEGKGGSQLVRALQKKVGAREDGYLGANTIKLIQTWLNIPVTGLWDAHTSRSFQLWINKQIPKKSSGEKSEKSSTPAPAPKITYQVPTAAEIKSASVWAVRHDICEWHKKMHNSKKNNRYKSFDDRRITQICPICNNLSGDGEGWNCIGEWAAGWRHGGLIPCKCNCEVLNNRTLDNFIGMTKDQILATAKSKIGVNELTVIFNNGNSIAPSKLLPGDCIVYYDSKESKHVATWVGNGLIADCSSANSPNISYGKKNISYWKIKVAIRYTGGRTYLSIGAKGAAVSKIQKIVGVTDDGLFGTATEAAVKKWQTAHKLTADGKVGPATLAEMKRVSA